MTGIDIQQVARIVVHLHITRTMQTHNRAPAPMRCRPCMAPADTAATQPASGTPPHAQHALAPHRRRHMCHAPQEVPISGGPGGTVGQSEADGGQQDVEP